MRNPALDILKAIAIFLVIIGHNSTGVLNNYIYSFHMPLFFIIAGYLWHEKHIIQSVSQDFKRIVIPYVTYFIIAAIIGYVISGVSLGRIEQDILKIGWGSLHGADVLGHHVQGVGFLWFLPALFVCKNAFNAIYVAWNKLVDKWQYSRVWMYLCIAVCMAIAAFIHRKYFPLPFGLTTGLNALGYFCIGHWVKMWTKDISYFDTIAWYYKLVIFTLWAGLGWFVRDGMAACEYHYVPLNFITGISGTILCYSLASWMNRSTKYAKKVLEIAGQYTISILIIHQLIADFGWLAKMDYDNNIIYRAHNLHRYGVCFSALYINKIWKETN